MRAGAFLLILTVFATGCAQPRATKQELAKQSGFGPDGRPLAFSVLPKTRVGDIDWVTAIKDGTLNPRHSLEAVPEPPGSVLNLDIVFNVGDSYPVPNVVFPHAPHTLWLSCSGCHPSIFAMKQGVNPVSMDGIVRGEFCGRCHGVVAFAITDCLRCHSRPKARQPEIPIQTRILP